MKHLAVRLYLLWSRLCAVITVYSPPVTVTMARRGRALSTGAPLQPFPSAAFMSSGCHGDQQWAWLHCASDVLEGATWCAFPSPLFLLLCCVEGSQLLAPLVLELAADTVNSGEHSLLPQIEEQHWGLVTYQNQVIINCLVLLKSSKLAQSIICLLKVV